jgi:hypothetical protein
MKIADKNISFLVRKYVPNRDKDNIIVETLEEALKIIGKKEEDIDIKVDWLNYTDLFFKSTKDYIRVKTLN